MAVLLFMKRMSDVTEVHSWKYAEDEEEAEREKLRKLSPHINVYEISGPLFFGAADVIGRIAVKDHAKCLILRSEKRSGSGQHCIKRHDRSVQKL